MIDSISNQAIPSDDSLIQGQSSITGTQTISVNNPAQNAGLIHFPSQVIDDGASISSEAKQRLAQFESVKPYVNQLQNQGGSFNSDRVSQFKNLLADGQIGNYLDSVLGQSADALLNNPVGKWLQSS